MSALPLSLRMDWRPAAPDLRRFVTAFAERRDAAACVSMRELPVPVPLLQIMLDSDFCLAGAHGYEETPRAALWGPTSTAARSRTCRPLHVFVAALTVRGAVALGRSAAGCLADSRTPLDALLSAASRRLYARVEDASSFEGRVAATEHWLRETFRDAARADPAIATIEAMLDHRLHGPVSGIAHAAGVSERALHKRCERLIGLSPKRLLRIARLQRVLAAVHPSPWLRRASPDQVRLEFTDDAHLVHDFKSLTGLTPSAYRHAKLASGDRLVHTLIDAEVSSGS